MNGTLKVPFLYEKGKKYWNIWLFSFSMLPDTINMGCKYQGKYMNIYYFLLSVKARNKKTETDWQIAEAILNLLNCNENLEIKTIANKAHTSVSTISRFVRRYGFESFGDFVGYFKLEKTLVEFDERISDSEEFLFENSNINELVHEIRKLNTGIDLSSMFETILSSKKVMFIGNPVPQSSYFLQTELEKRGISTYNVFSLIEQLEHLNSINKDELIFLFNYGYYEISSITRLNKNFLSNKTIYIGPQLNNQKVLNPAFNIILPNENMGRNLLLSNYVVFNLSEVIRKTFPPEGNNSRYRK